MIKVLRLSLGVMELDKIRNKHIRGNVHVYQLEDKTREVRLKWFGHVQRKELEVRSEVENENGSTRHGEESNT